MYYGREIPFPKDNVVFNFVHGDDFEFQDPETKLLEKFLFMSFGEHKKSAFESIPPGLFERMTSENQKNIMTQVFKQSNQDARKTLDKLKSIELPKEILSIFTGLVCRQINSDKCLAIVSMV